MRAPGIALLSGCAFVAIMLLVMYWHPLAAIDQIVSSQVVELRSDMADNAMFLLTSMADARVLIITDVAIVALLIAARHWRLALASASVFIGCALSVQLIKLFVQRARPTPTLYEGISAFSFPSGHAANFAVMIAVLLWLMTSAQPDRRRTMTITLLLTAVALVGFSRIYLLVHWPSDVIASYLLALCILSLGHLLLAGTRTSTPIRIYRWSLAIWILVGGVHATTGLALQLNP